MFHIRRLIIAPSQEDHLWDKHRVTVSEVDECCGATLLVLRGREGGFAVFGRTVAGRYLVLFIYPRGDGTFALATARDLTQTERRRVRGLTPRDLYDDEEG